MNEFVFVIENKIGGVAYLNKNLINKTSLKKFGKVRVIMVSQSDDNQHRFTDIVDADEVIDFSFASYENKYSVMVRLHKLFGDSPGAIICNDGLEMQTIYHFGTKKTVYQIVHDFYNLRLAVKWGAITDVFIAHSKLFSDVLLSADPSQVQSFYRPHGVPIPAKRSKINAGPIGLVFAGRLVEAKGVMSLYEINSKLEALDIDVRWTIIGKGPLSDKLHSQWKDSKNVRFLTPDTNEEVLMIMADHDVFILPTSFEGSPVTVMESLACGLTPIVSDLPGGIREIISNEVGIRIPLGNVKAFADAIRELHYDRSRLEEKKSSARKLALENFNIQQTSEGYIELFTKHEQFKQHHSNLPHVSYGFRLDKKWIPNAIVSMLRKQKIKGT